MELNSFELFAFFLCSCLFGTLFSVWATTDLLTDREMWLVTVVFAAVAFSLLAQFSNGEAVLHYLSRNTAEVEDKQLADVKEAHRRHVATLKHHHKTETHQLQSSLHSANAKFDRLLHDYDWITGEYQDQMRNTQEREDRIAYLEMKLQEFGQFTPGRRAPFSAPATQINFSNPPRRNRIEAAMRSPTVPSPLSQVVEAEEE